MSTKPVHVSTPQVFQGSVADAFAKAKELTEPIFVPQSVFADDRGWSLMNQFVGVMQPSGQVNFSVQYPGVVKAWHAHTLQTDFWLCVQGHLKVGVYREGDHRAWSIVTGEKRPGVVIIPPPLWHGACTVGNSPAALLYYLTHQFNPAKPDENRRAWDSVPGFPWAVENK